MITSSNWERFWPKVDASGDCWEWTAAINQSTGYGYFHFVSDGRPSMEVAHRASWRLLVGPIENGITLDHLCRNHKCVNPDHMEPVTNQVNIARGFSPSHVIKRSGVCSRGHRDQWTPNGKYRRCLACRSIQWANWSARRKIGGSKR